VQTDEEANGGVTNPTASVGSSDITTQSTSARELRSASNGGT